MSNQAPRYSMCPLRCRNTTGALIYSPLLLLNESRVHIYGMMELIPECPIGGCDPKATCLINIVSRYHENWRACGLRRTLNATVPGEVKDECDVAQDAVARALSDYGQ